MWETKLFEWTKYKEEFKKDVTSEAANMYFGALNSLAINYKIIYPLGITNFFNSELYKDKEEERGEFAYVSNHIYYSSIYNMSFTLLEVFLWRFLIEKLNDPKIKARKELETHLEGMYKRKYKEEYKEKKIHISFQNLYSVSMYYKDKLGIDLKKYFNFKRLSNDFINLRHGSTHNFGIKNEKEFQPISMLALEVVIPGRANGLYKIY